MQELNNRIEELEEILQQEIESVMLFQKQENLVKACLSSRDWPGLEQNLKQVQIRAGELEALESLRLRVWTELKSLIGDNEATDFYQVVSSLPQASRRTLTDLRGKLKVAVVGLKGLTSGLENYVEVTSSLIQGAIQEARPSLRGKIYSHKGQIKQTGTASLVLDRQF